MLDPVEYREGANLMFVSLSLILSYFFPYAVLQFSYNTA